MPSQNEPMKMSEEGGQIERLEGRIRALESLLVTALTTAVKGDRKGTAEIAARIQKFFDNDTLDRLPESFGQGFRETLRNVKKDLLR